MTTKRLTMAQAIILFLQNQYVERDGQENAFFAGCWGIFGHGNVAGIGQALQQYSNSFRYYQARNEQAMVHAASAYTKMKNRLQTFRLHLVNRAGCDQYDYGCGGSHHQPLTCAFVTRRHLCRASASTCVTTD